MFSQYSRHNKGILLKLLILALVAFLGLGLVFGFAYAEGDSSTNSTPQTTESDTPDETVIDTGNAIAEGDILNDVNTNNLNTSNSSSEDEAISTESTEVNTASSIPTNTSSGNNNNASVENTADVSANTGDNGAVGNESATINTGDAVATANVVNAVNTNIYNSNGLFLFLNSLFGQIGEIDLRTFGIFGGTPEENSETVDGCPSGCEALNSLSINNQNNAGIVNNVTVGATTGGNDASGGGDGTINTGDAYASANVVNLANINIVDSNYLVLTFNNFGSWAGDLVFPPGSFFEQIFGRGGGVGGGLNVNNTNTATVSNNVSTESNTGENEANGNASGDGGTINTGNAISSTNVVNQVNTNIVNNDSFAVLLRVHGNWAGNIFSAPSNVAWANTAGGGLELFITGEGSGSSTSNNGQTVIANSNQASIENNINVFALTGKNKINDSGDALIQTGNAYSSANIINIANTNILGRNWILAIVNIFGDWTGDLAFGRPDVWIGEIVKVKNDPVVQGDRPTYNFTVINRGDAPATDVTVVDRFDNRLLSFVNSESPYYQKHGLDSATFKIGTLEPGQSVELSYSVQVNPNIPYGFSEAGNSVTVTSFEDDQNFVDNTDVGVVNIYGRLIPAIGHDGIKYDEPPRIRISKLNNTTGPLTAGTPVDYKITLANEGGGTAYDAILVDTMINDNGDVIYKEVWPLGDVKMGEEINVSYQIFFNGSTTPGIYTNNAQVFALQYHPDPEYGLIYESRVAKSIVKFFKRKEVQETGGGGWTNENQFEETGDANEKDLERLREDLQPILESIIKLQKDILALGEKVEQTRLALLKLKNSQKPLTPTPKSIVHGEVVEEEEFATVEFSPAENSTPITLDDYSDSEFVESNQIASMGALDKNVLPKGSEHLIYFVLFFLIRLGREGRLIL